MAMTLSFHENLDLPDALRLFETGSAVIGNSPAADERMHLFAEKMRVPPLGEFIARPRLCRLLEKSSAQIGATLVTGRAESGKTVLAADFARRYRKVAWYQIDATESEWPLFARYFAAVCEQDYDALAAAAGDEVALFVERLVQQAAGRAAEPLLVVLDDIHQVFDAPWFAEFFVSLLGALAPPLHLVMLSRLKPPQPLWRLRSKQVLGVIDEKLLSFNVDETAEFLAQNEISTALAPLAHAQTFGRIAALKKQLRIEN